MIAKVTEITAESPESFDHAIKTGLTRAKKTLSGIRGAWIKEQQVILDDGVIKGFRVNMKVTFVLED